MSKSVFLAVTGLQPEPMIQGVFDTREGAEKAIEENDPYDSLHCYVLEMTVNEWVEEGVDL